MRLSVRIPWIEPGIYQPPEVCPHPDCDGHFFKPHQNGCPKPVRDPKHEEVEAQRWRCLKCDRTFRVYPKGVSSLEMSPTDTWERSSQSSWCARPTTKASAAHADTPNHVRHGKLKVRHTGEARRTLQSKPLPLRDAAVSGSSWELLPLD